MRATLLEDHLTPYSHEEAIESLHDAYVHVIDEQPTPESLNLLVAQTALETGQWKSIHHHNWGNVKASSRYRGLYTMFRCNENIDGKLVWFDPPHVQTRFRAYRSADEGAAEYVRFLAIDTTPNNGRPNRYEAAWDALEMGDLESYTRALKAAGYYTAGVGIYLRAMSALASQFMPKVAEFLDAVPGTFKEPPVAEPGILERLAALENWRAASLEAAAT